MDRHQCPGTSVLLEVTFTPAGHILGSSCVHVTHKADARTVVFSGDVGRQNDIIMRPPEPIQKADVLVCESTYGDRAHGESDPEAELAEIITKTAGRGGIVLMPAFAVGRAQMLLYVVHKLMGQGSLKPEKVYITHGEVLASDVMRKRIRERFGWDVEVPELYSEVLV